MALKNFTQFTPYTTLSSTDFLVGYRSLDEIRTDLDSMSLGVSALLISKGFLPGTIVGRVQRVSYRYTIASGSPVNAVSGADDNGLTLSYTPGQVEVYRNGSHLVNSLDFLATTSTQITNLSTLNLGDIVEVVALSGIGATIQYQLSGFIGSLVQRNYRYSVATGNTIVPGSTLISGADDYGSVLAFNTNSFQVYLNGSHLVRDYDYSAFSSGTSLTLAMPVAAGDSVDVVSLSACFTSALSSISAFSGISRLNNGDRVTLSNSTGNVTVSSQTCNSDFPATDWTNGSHISRWGTLQAYLSGVAASNTSPANASYLNFIACPPQITPAYLFASVLHPNGKIYSIQDGSFGVPPTYVSILDPETSTISLVALLAGRGAGLQSGQGGVVAANGKIFFNDSMPTICFDPSNNTSTTFGYPSIADGYEGGILAPNGKIYFVPNTATAVLRVDPDALTATTLGNMLIGGNEGYKAACLAPNGKIYMFPDNTKTNLVLLDPNNDTITQFTYPAGVFPGNSLRTTFNLAPNGKIYMFSNHLTLAHAILDPVDNSVSTINVFPPATGAYPYFQMALAPDGKFYGGYGGAVSVAVVFDPSNNTQTTFNQISLGGSGSYTNVIMTPKGKIVYIPYFATSYLILNKLNNNNFDINVCTNPFFNKF